MKKAILVAITALIGVFFPISAKAQLWGGGFDGNGDPIPAGDLNYSFLAFKSSAGTGATQDIIFQLGNLNTLLADGASFTINQSAANSILSSTYGTDWATAGNVSWAVLGSDNSTLKFTRSAASLPSSLKGDKFNTINANIVNFEAFAGNSELSYVTTSLGSITAAVGNDTLSGSFSIADGSNLGGSFASTLGSLNSALSLYTYTYPGNNNSFATASLLGSMNLNSGTFTFTGAIPEPSTYALMGLGALLLVIAYRRKSA